MFKRSLVLGSIMALLAGWVVLADSASSADSPSPVDLLPSRCISIKAKLEHIYINETPIRINYGQAYEDLLNKVITPANTRLVANGYAGGEIVNLSAEFSQDLERFRLAYQKYQQQLKLVKQLDCRNQPEKFYQQLVKLREERQQINQKIVDLNSELERYLREFNQLTKSDEDQAVTEDD